MTVTLLPHQSQAAAFIKARPASMIADSPGLGKTFSAIAGAATVSHPGQWAIIAPRNVLSQWKDAIERYTNGSYSLKNILITNYEQVHKHMDKIKAAKVLILDESHMLKNVESQRFNLIAPICQDISKKIIMLTGTPVFSYPKDLFGQLYCMRLIGGNEYATFLDRYCGPKLLRIRVRNPSGNPPYIFRRRWVYQGCTNAPELSAKFAPYILRRDWKDVGITMPPLTMSDVEINLSQGNLSSTDILTYQTAAADFDLWYKNATSKNSTGLEKFTVLRRLLALAKVPAVLEQLELELQSNIKILVFTDFRDVAESIYRERSKTSPDSTFLIEGGQSEKHRESVFNFFGASSNSCVLVATTDSLNVGVNLQSATRIYFVDLGFKPASFVQAVGRSWRMGQQSPVSVLRFIVKDSMDEFVSKNIIRKEDYMQALGLQSTVSLGGAV